MRSAYCVFRLTEMTIDLGFALHPKWVEHTTLETFLAPLETAGMRVLEFTLHPEGDEWLPMQALAERCVRAGYRCHFHAPYHDPFNPAGFASARRAQVEQLYAPTIEMAERLARESQFNAAFVINGARGTAPREGLIEDTRQFLAWTLEQTRHVRPMLELLPPAAGLNKVGDTRDEVLAIVREFDNLRLGLCWDLGHDAFIGYSDVPRADFLAAVRHVHIHDLNAAREDHFPLVFGNVPWQADLRALMNVGYTGAVVLEINGYRAASVPRLFERLAESFTVMSQVVVRIT